MANHSTYERTESYGYTPSMAQNVVDPRDIPYLSMSEMEDDVFEDPMSSNRRGTYRQQSPRGALGTYNMSQPQSQRAARGTYNKSSPQRAALGTYNKPSPQRAARGTYNKPSPQRSALGTYNKSSPQRAGLGTYNQSSPQRSARGTQNYEPALGEFEIDPDDIPNWSISELEDDVFEDPMSSNRRGTYRQQSPRGAFGTYNMSQPQSQRAARGTYDKSSPQRAARGTYNKPSPQRAALGTYNKSSPQRSARGTQNYEPELGEFEIDPDDIPTMSISDMIDDVFFSPLKRRGTYRQQSPRGALGTYNKGSPQRAALGTYNKPSPPRQRAAQGTYKSSPQLQRPAFGNYRPTPQRQRSALGTYNAQPQRGALGTYNMKTPRNQQGAYNMRTPEPQTLSDSFFYRNSPPYISEDYSGRTPRIQYDTSPRTQSRRRLFY